MTVYLVGAGPGDPGLLTRRGADLLASADVVVYDRLVDRALLALAPEHAVLVDAGKRPGQPAGEQPAGEEPAGEEPAGGQPAGELPVALSPVIGVESRQRDINELLVDHGRKGRTVVRLKGGDPFVFGRGGEEAEALQRAGVPFEVVPGVSSAVAVPAAAGIPVTHRGVSSSVTVVTGHVEEDTTPGVDWESLARAGGTLVILMGMATRDEISQRLQAGGRPADTPVAVVEWGATPRQRSERSTLGDLGSVDLEPPAVIVVGPVASLDFLWSRDRPLGSCSVVVTRAAGQSQELLSALTAAGARVIELPVIAISPPEDAGEALERAAERVADYDWVVFTSANAVRRFVPLLRDTRSFGRARVAVVGKATASALLGYHVVADLVPEVQTAAGLCGSFPEPPGEGGRVLFPRSEQAKGDVTVGLRTKGWEVDDIVSYRTVPVGPLLDAVTDAVREADVVTFTSSSCVSAYLSLTDKDGRPLPVPPVVACLGPVTAKAAADAGLMVDVVADSPSASSLVAGLSTYREAIESKLPSRAE